METWSIIAPPLVLDNPAMIVQDGVIRQPGHLFSGTGRRLAREVSCFFLDPHRLTHAHTGANRQYLGTSLPSSVAAVSPAGRPLAGATSGRVNGPALSLV
jgi:hypothetical protein